METTETIDLDRKINPAFAGRLGRRVLATRPVVVAHEDLSGVTFRPQAHFMEIDTAGCCNVSEGKPPEQSLLSFVEGLGLFEAPPDERLPASLLITLASLDADLATGYFALRPGDLCPEDLVDWERWHELLDIRGRRDFTASEQGEYQQLAAFVARLDAKEEAVADAAVDALVKKHERFLAWIERLTDAVKVAAERA